jgi:MFS family permease
MLLALVGARDDLTRGEFQRLVLFAAIPAALGVLLLTRIRESSRPAPEAQPSHAMRPTFVLPASMAERRYLLVVFAFALGNSSDAFLVLRMVDVNIGVISVLLVLAGRNLVEALLSIPAGALSDRVGRRELLLAGDIVYAAIYGGLALADSAVAVVVLVLAYGAYYGAAEGIGRAFVADLAPAGALGASYGWFHMATAIAALPASVLAGVLWTAYGPAAAFAFGSVCSVLAALLLTTVTPPRRLAIS